VEEMAEDDPDSRVREAAAALVGSTQDGT